MAAQTDTEGTAPEQDEQNATFAQLCAEHDLLKRPIGLDDQDLDDGLIDLATLFRFLAARGYDQNAALNQFKESTDFRSEKDIVRLYDVVEVADFERARQFYPHWTGHRDKNGLPICMFEMSHLDQAALDRWEESRHAPGWTYTESDTKPPAKPDMLQLAAVFHDSLTRFILPLCSMMTDRPNPEGAVTHSIYLVDASSLGLKQSWSLRFFSQQISWLLSTCYPETIKRVFVCNAPAYYTVIWKYLKRFVDPHTASKLVVLTSSEVLPTLKEHIDDANVPTILGGDLSFEHGMPPDLDESIRQSLNWETAEQSLPPGPIKLVKDADGRKTALAVGSESGLKRSVRIATLKSVDAQRELKCCRAELSQQ